ncbi:hypothetical protein [Hymenobacter sp. AT01-02]|uniref:hypothetical protein n=1 Tax=Hymenobacter sp. AT01-02 TaxID=1571877 RepID=UPI000ABDCA5E|nr:hypothetical protein [Hymenobacter sp. AT01-02]
MLYRLVCACLLLPSLVWAQTTPRTLPPPQSSTSAPLTPNSALSLQQALQTGLGQSLLVQTGTLEVQRQRALSRTGYDVPRTVIDYQYGQISGPLADQSVNIVQQSLCRECTRLLAAC